MVERRGLCGSLLFTGIVLIPAAACKKPPFEVSHTAYILGPTNDIRPVDAAAEGQVSAAVVASAVLIATSLDDKRVKFCSGTLLPPAGPAEQPRVITNHHCFAIPGPDGKATAALAPEACRQTTVWFGFRPGVTESAVPVGCAAGSLRTDFDGDLAVLTLAGPPPAWARPGAFWEGPDEGAGRPALIVHHPDVDTRLAVPPGGGPKLPTMAVTTQDCKVVGNFPVAEWELDRTLPFSLRHTCDLIHGSSGSGLIDVETGRILGVNWGGIKVLQEGGVTRTDNVATRAAYVIAFLGHKVEVARADAERRRSADAERAAAERPARGPASRVLSRWCGVAGAGAGGASCLMLLALLAPLVLAFPARSATATPTPAAAANAPNLNGAAVVEAPDGRWLVSHLMNTLFAADYQSAGDRQPGGGSAARVPAGVTERAAIARSAAAARGQRLAGMAGLPERRDLDVERVAATFPDGGPERQAWDLLKPAYTAMSLGCAPVSAADLQPVLSALADLERTGRAGNPQALAAVAAGWERSRAVCTLAAMLGAFTPDGPPSQAADPLPLLLALRQSGPAPLATDIALAVMTVIRQVESGRYADALALLMDLHAGDAAFRLPYELAQRIYSRRQKGDGSVALKGL